MAEKKMKGCLQLNQHLMQAMSKQVLGSPTNRDQILLLTQAKLLELDVLKELLEESNVKPLFDLQTELSRIVAADEIDMEEIFRFHQLVSKAMRNNFKRETLILVNMEISQAMVDGSQEVIRDKSVSALRLLSQGMIDGAGNEDVVALFKLKEALTQAIAEKSEDKKLELIASSNLLLAKFMAAGYPDASTEWLMELNHFAALALVSKIRTPVLLQKSINVLSRELRASSDEAVFKDSMELIFTLSSMLLETDTDDRPSFFDQLVTWKIQLSKVMQELLGESSKQAMKKAADEVIVAQTEAVKAENRKLRDEIDQMKQSIQNDREETRRLLGKEAALRQELKRGDEKIAELVSEIAKLEEMTFYEEEDDEKNLNDQNNICSQNVETSEEGAKIPEKAEIAKPEHKVDEAKSEAPAVEEKVTRWGAKKPNVGGGGNGTGSGEATGSTAKFPNRNRRVKLYGIRKDSMNDVYLPPVSQHRGNQTGSPRGRAPRNQPQEETP